MIEIENSIKNYSIESTIDISYLDGKLKVKIKKIS